MRFQMGYVELNSLIWSKYDRFKVTKCLYNKDKIVNGKKEKTP